MDGFDNLLSFNQLNVHAGLAYRLNRCKLDASLVNVAGAVVLFSWNDGERPCRPFKITCQDGRRLFQLSDIGVMKWTIMNAMIGTPSVVWLLEHQCRVALDTDGFRHAVLFAPITYDRF